ncbi:MAG: 2-oxo acid dehydrogenase subunit E2, partial [Flavisolibacter sp.]|nr:2-oxo acid dehydrogenase subunit E2 [Flavisolibacter sp.]
MATVDLVMPKMGESIMEATILKWHKQPGDIVKMDETLLEIATDKVDSEVPSTAEGVVEELLYKVNDVVPIGAVIARIKTDVQERVVQSQPAAPTPAVPAPDNTVSQPKVNVAQPSANQPQVTATSANNARFYSPL